MSIDLRGEADDLLVDVSVKDGRRTTYIPASMSERNFAIRLADKDEGRNPASMLIQQRYAWRGYAYPDEASSCDPESITLLASSRNGMVFGTLSIRLGTGLLMCEEAFSAEVAAVRSRESKVCEIGLFAVQAGDRYVMGALFHTAYIYGHLLHGASYVLIEVNRRHVSFYERALGFSVLADERMCARAQAPAVLLGATAEGIKEYIRRKGVPGDSGRGGFLYKYCFSRHEEDGLLGRIKILCSGGAYQRS